MGDYFSRPFCGDMDARVVFKGGTLVRDGRREVADILVANGKIERIASAIEPEDGDKVVCCEGRVVMSGLVDLHVRLKRLLPQEQPQLRTVDLLLFAQCPILTPLPIIWRICSSSWI